MIKRFLMGLAVVIVFVFLVSIFIGGINNNEYYKKGGNVSKKSYNKNNDDLDIVKKNTEDCEITVYMSNEKKIENLNLEEYVKGVVPSEMPAEFNIEALKAQAIAARTFAVCHMEEFGGKKYKDAYGADVVNTVQCQVYTDKKDVLSKFPKDKANEYWNKVSTAVEDTKGEVITYKNKIITDPYYFSVSSGKTENIKEVLNEDKPYLRSVSSPGEESASKYKTTLKMSYSDFVDKINSCVNNKINSIQARMGISIVKKNSTGSVNEVKVGNNVLLGTKFRTILGLNSTNFQIKYNISSIEFDCIGYGHGLGMSQWGAKAMADKGSNYKDIIKHYYTGVEIKNISY
ncbi:stage II sporulation protein D [Clostridium felsineum]|uniref:stage II sporulation protein D n=1 Tax=Clostridium felsineum TaxID=36839 RepID=UPI00098C0968|nr:stage II sporulation protein D [Clostridium felsineum]MCR3758392.1 stage II sporulation protein D [Clostridium felsineum]URZ15037.1 hypothetical protein CLFE_010500 [Clostridium felsineum DSM 794]